MYSADTLNTLCVFDSQIAIAQLFEVHRYDAKTDTTWIFDGPFLSGATALSRVTALEFGEKGRFVWVGYHNGTILLIDTVTNTRLGYRDNVHLDKIVMIARNGREMVSVDKSGRVVVWSATEQDPLTTLAGQCRDFELPLRPHWARCLDGRLWAYATEPGRRASQVSPSSTFGHLSVAALDVVGKANSFERKWPLDRLGKLTCGTVLPCARSTVFFGHE